MGYEQIKVGIAAIIQNEKDEILLQLRKKEPYKGKWSIPTGHIEPFEKVEDCVRRELNEELNIETQIEKFVALLEDTETYEDEHFIAPCYQVTVTAGEINNNEPEVHEKCEWILRKCIIGDDYSNLTRQAIEEFNKITDSHSKMSVTK